MAGQGGFKSLVIYTNIHVALISYLYCEPLAKGAVGVGTHILVAKMR